MKRAVICFTRVPKPGITKTRLLPILTGEQCAKLHSAFLTDLARVYAQVDADLFVAYTVDPEWEMLKNIFPDATDFFPQEGADLGEKMYNAIGHVLALGYGQAVLTGADLPMMTESHLNSGFAALENAHVAIGPTSDGGYYLVGMKHPHRAIFENQSYGGTTVLENTLSAGKTAGLTVVLAAPCDDVDTPEDLKNLGKVLSPETATYRYLKELKEEGVSL